MVSSTPFGDGRRLRGISSPRKTRGHRRDPVTGQATSGLRAAEPGEFARRGFINGKMDLSQAEALADLIDSQTAFQRRQALRVAGGALRRQVEDWRRALVDAWRFSRRNWIFPTKATSDSFSYGALQGVLGPLISGMEDVLSRAPASERLREGFLVLIMGPPNAGKSTLLNRLAQRDVAIVSEIPGTTRDMIEVHLNIDGIPVTLVDTAGLRDTEDAIEQIGVARTRARAGDADLLLWLSEGGAEPFPDVGADGGEILRVATKADRFTPQRVAAIISAQTGVGIECFAKKSPERRARRLATVHPHW